VERLKEDQSLKIHLSNIKSVLHIYIYIIGKEYYNILKKKKKKKK